MIDYTAEGLLGLVVAMVMFGWLVPARQIKRLEQAVDVKDELIRELTTQNGELMEMARLAQSTFRAMQGASE